MAQLILTLTSVMLSTSTPFLNHRMFGELLLATISEPHGSMVVLHLVRFTATTATEWPRTGTELSHILHLIS